MTTEQADILERMIGGAMIEIANSTTYALNDQTVTGVMVGNLRRAGWIEYREMFWNAGYRISRTGRVALAEHQNTVEQRRFNRAASRKSARKS